KKAGERSSKHNAARIKAGRGQEKFSDSAEKAKQRDPLAQRWLALAREESALRDHQQYRQTHGTKFVRAEGKRRFEQTPQPGAEDSMPNNFYSNGAGGRVRDQVPNGPRTSTNNSGLIRRARRSGQDSDEDDSPGALVDALHQGSAGWPSRTKWA